LQALLQLHLVLLSAAAFFKNHALLVSLGREILVKDPIKNSN
jgi:hypothetical protein